MVLLFLIPSGTSKRSEILLIANVEIDKINLELHANEGRWYDQANPFNGYAVSYHKNGALAEHIGYFEGKKEGIAKKWFDDETVQKVGLL